MRPDTPPRPTAGTVILCCALLSGFAALAWSAALTKNATFDEPHHAIASWVQLWRGDFRIDPPNGALWHDIAALATPPGMLRADFESDDFRLIPQQPLRQWRWVVQTLYRTPGNDADAFLNRQRAIMLVLAVGLGALTTIWAWQLGGRIAAVVSSTLFCLDPNLIAHAALVKNDIAFALATLAVAMLSTSVGRRPTVAKLIGLGVLVGAGVGVKFSGVVLLPLVGGLLGCRAMMTWRWPAFGRAGERVVQRLFLAVGAVGLVAAVGFVSVWGVYRFRFAPTADPHLLLDESDVVRLATSAEITLRTGNADPSSQEIAAVQPGRVVQTVLWVEQHRLMPQAFCNGVLYQYQANLLRAHFFDGRNSLLGNWSYFPLAILWKTPITMIGIFGIGAAVGLLIIRRGASAARSWESWWIAICVTAPPALILAGAMASNVNVGIRHLFGLYPFVYLGIGCVAAAAWERWPGARQLGRGFALALMISLACEVAIAYPDYIAYFNAAVGGPQAGIRLLGDSNLDWGQDLKTLAAWQRTHESVPLYFSYFGLADPAYYGIHYVNLTDGYAYGPTFQWPSAPGVIAISVSNIQGFSMDAGLYQTFYHQFSRLTPFQILGGTIYLFRWQPADRPIRQSSGAGS